MSDWVTQTRKARKRYICDVCGVPIERGERYTRNPSLYHGVLSSLKNCDPCNEVIREIVDEGYTVDEMSLSPEDVDAWSYDSTSLAGFLFRSRDRRGY